jgi:hypothetical protein
LGKGIIWRKIVGTEFIDINYSSFVPKKQVCFYRLCTIARVLTPSI